MASILRSSPLLPLYGIACASREMPRGFHCLSMKLEAAPMPLRFAHTRYPSRPARIHSVLAFAASEEAAKTEETEKIETQVYSDEEPNVDDNSSDYSSDELSEDGTSIAEEQVTSPVIASLQSYREALAADDQSKVAEIEAFLQSIEDEKNSVAEKVSALSVELLVERDRVLRISADFDNFRKRTERERLSLMDNVQGEVVESLFPVLDSFERAKGQIKVETEGEEKVNNSYQSIYKQFVEILTSLGVEAIETVGNVFDPMLHEAIMRGESTEFEEGIIIQEFRKGFKLGERLLRPSMVKVSAGPGPAKPEKETSPIDEDNVKIDEESSVEGVSV
ncbi:hypothetical protein AXF42_Ash018585 [Apostasia shenzhenica]|uniref:GrpE protein homolog n=1 Tax=Apostasia shenzhenica TaxID=1088818 RepID=A0A2I0APX9_9ASPA|nr:hypothetical protein AXF42_Ash018585 [Apostasia shenzhenica]